MSGEKIRQAVVETLEPRRLLSSVTFSDGIMILEGDHTSSDRIVVQMSNRGTMVWGLINNSGRGMPAVRVDEIQIRTLGGQDRIRIHPHVTVPVTIVHVDPASEAAAGDEPPAAPTTPGSEDAVAPVAPPAPLPVYSGNLNAPVPMIQLAGGAGLPGQAIHVSALESQVSSGSLLTATYEWDFGNPGGGYNQLGGWTTAHVYDEPGTYTITLTVTDEAGNSASTSTQFTVNNDARRTIYVAASGRSGNDGLTPDRPVTLGQALELAGDDTRILLQRGDVYTVSDTIHLPWSNVMIGAYGGGENPLLRATGPMTILSGTDASRGITIENLRFDTANAGTGKVGVTAIRVQGEGLVIRDNVFLNLDDAVNANGRPQYLLVQGNASPLEGGLRGYMIWGEGQDHVYLGNFVRNSTDEHPIRVGGTGVQRLLVAHNELRNPGGKTAMRLNVATDAWVEDNLFWNRVEIGGVPDPNREHGQAAEKVVFTRNAVHEELRIEHGADEVLVRSNVLHGNGQAAISVRLNDSRWPDRSVSGLRIEQNQVYNDAERGMFMMVQGRAEGAITLTGNRYIAPLLVPGWAGEPAFIRVMDGDLGSFRSIDNNLWPDVNPAARTGGGVFFVQASLSKEGYRTLEWWNAQPQVGSDSLYMV